MASSGSPSKSDKVEDITRPTAVGALACQMKSYLKELTTTVISCTPVISTLVADKEGEKGKKAKTSEPPSPTSDATANAADPASPTEFDIVFHNSVLFPEGGGQPHDTGVINGNIRVKKVRRVGDTCVVTTDQPLSPGQEAHMIVDWNRRQDHMQHHTAQHVLTAVVEEMLKLPTESWAMSSPTCYIQVPSNKVTAEDLQRVEERCNDYIAKQTPVHRHVFSSREEVPESRSRGIPKDVNGPIRLIEVAGLDTCTCCGTHVENLSELHFIKLLYVEPKGDTARIHFVTGARAIDQFGALFQRERALVKEVGTSADNLLSTIQRRTKDANDAQKQVKKLMEEVGALIAPTIAADAASHQGPGPFLYLREDADIDFLNIIATAIKAKSAEKLCLLACGSLKGGPGEGAFLLFGNGAKEFLDQSVVPGLDAKGGGSPKTGYRGKCHMKNWKNFVKSFGAAQKEGPPSPASPPATGMQ